MNDVIRKTTDAAVNIKGLSSCSLKRKRPPMIQIPKSFFGVYDGHGGSKAAAFVSENLHLNIFGVYDGHGGSKAAEFVSENLHLNIFNTFESCNFKNKATEDAVKDAYLQTDENFLRQGFGSGAYCVTAVIDGDELVVSNLGDCRAVLCRDGIAQALTTDHRAAQGNERKKIEDKGGYVEFNRGTWRVHGTLAVSRSIEDAHLKDWVIAEPDTKVMPLTSDLQYLILASDGLWEEVSNQEAVETVLRSCSGTSYKNQLVRSVHKRQFPIVSPVIKKRIYHHHQKRSEEYGLCDENVSPPSKSRRISSVKQMKIDDENQNKDNVASIEK